MSSPVYAQTLSDTMGPLEASSIPQMPLGAGVFVEPFVHIRQEDSAFIDPRVNRLHLRIVRVGSGVQGSRFRPGDVVFAENLQNISRVPHAPVGVLDGSVHSVFRIDMSQVSASIPGYAWPENEIKDMEETMTKNNHAVDTAIADAILGSMMSEDDIAAIPCEPLGNMVIVEHCTNLEVGKIFDVPPGSEGRLPLFRIVKAGTDRSQWPDGCQLGTMIWAPEISMQSAIPHNITDGEGLLRCLLLCSPSRADAIYPGLSRSLEGPAVQV